jgi:hypothetical protein
MADSTIRQLARFPDRPPASNLPRGKRWLVLLILNRLGRDELLDVLLVPGRIDLADDDVT